MPRSQKHMECPSLLLSTLLSSAKVSHQTRSSLFKGHWMARELWRSSCLCNNGKVTGTCVYPAFYIGAENPKSGLHALSH